MRGLTSLMSTKSRMRVIGPCAIILIALSGTLANARPAGDEHASIVVVFKDGHRQSFAVAEIASLDFKAPSVIVYKDGHREKISASEIARIEFETPGISAMTPSRAHFIGKWEVGEGTNGNHFFITLESDGDARKTLGASHGTWTLVDGEARVTWDDGWKDVIRKVGTKHEKVAFEPGKSFDDSPSNVTEARNTDPKPI